MPGFLGTNFFFKSDIKNKNELLIRSLNSESIYFEQRTVNKFLNDKIFEEIDDYIIITEGVILNSKELQIKYDKRSLKETIIEMYQKYGETFFSKFRGSFSGVFYDKKKSKLIVFTDHIGDKQVFYHKSSNKIVFGSDIDFLMEVLKENKIDYTLDEISAYSLLTYGYMLEGMTLFNEIKKIKAGEYLKLENGKLEIKRFHRFLNKSLKNMTDDEIIKKIDDLFDKAMEMQIEKNAEYDYPNLAPLSAGLDSRITNFALKKLYKGNITNITYSESGFYDEKISQKISIDLKNHSLFKTLDNGLSLNYFEEIVKITKGMVLFGGPCQVWDIFKLINTNEYGLIHTGMLGDVIIGTFYTEKKDGLKAKIGDGAYSQKMISKLDMKLNQNFIKSYENQEIFNFYNRGFTGANMGSPLIFQERTESFSPFYDVEFLEFCLSIPVEKRWKNNIYDKWVVKKYPEATKYLHNGIRKISVKKSKEINLFGKKVLLEELPRKVYDKFIKSKITNGRNNMNPFDYWYKNNSDLKNKFDTYFEDNLKKLDVHEELQKDCKDLYENGKTIEKTMVLTLLSFLVRYF